MLPTNCTCCLCPDYKDFEHRSGFTDRLFECGACFELDGFDNVNLWEPCDKAHETAVALRAEKDKYKDISDML